MSDGLPSVSFARLRCYRGTAIRFCYSKGGRHPCAAVARNEGVVLIVFARLVPCENDGASDTAAAMVN